MHNAEKHLFGIMLTPDSDADGDHISTEVMINFVEKKTRTPNRDEIFRHINQCKRCNTLYGTIAKAYSILEPHVEKAPLSTDRIQDRLIDFFRSFSFAKPMGWTAGVAVAAACVMFAIVHSSAPDVYKKTFKANLAMETVLQEQYSPALGDEEKWHKKQLVSLIASLPVGSKLRDMKVEDLDINNGLLVAMVSSQKGGVMLTPKEKVLFELRDGTLYVRSPHIVTTVATAVIRDILKEQYDANRFPDQMKWAADRIKRLLANLPPSDRLEYSKGLKKLILGPDLNKAKKLLFKAEGETLHITTFRQE